MMEKKKPELLDLLARPGAQQAYDRIAPFYRLAEQIILLRKKRRLTQTELAQAAETTQAVISRLENATVHCSVETVIRVAEALNAKVAISILPNEAVDEPEEEIAEPDCTDLEPETPNIIYFKSTTMESCSSFNSWQNFSALTQQQAKKARKVEYA